MRKLVLSDTLKYFKTIERQKIARCLRGLAKDSESREEFKIPLKHEIEVWHYSHSFRVMKD